MFLKQERGHSFPVVDKDYMKIAMITPAPALRRLWVYRQGGKIYGQPNSVTGPLILGGILKRAGHEVRAYEELNGKVDFKYVYSCDVVCISTMTSTAPRAYELADMIHQNNPRARVLIGGMHASVMPEEAAEHADQVMVGEGEKTILDVVEGRRTDKIVTSEPICNLDEVPFPDYSILQTPVKAANVISTRGCPFRCTFCTTSRMFAPYRQRSIDNVIEEIRMYKNMGFQYMNFEDDNFTADKERAKEICRRMIQENLVFKETFFFGRTDLARDEELLKLLKEAHLTRVLIGIESLNQEALNDIHKQQSVEDIRRAAAACKAHGIRLIASIVVGLDADGREDIRRAVQFAKDIDAYQLQPAVLTPFPGTPVYEQYQKEDRLLPSDWTQHDLMTVTYLPKKLSAWEVQDEFYHASKYFYDYKSAPRIGKLFGAEYGWRRFGFAFAAHAGPDAARWASNHVTSSYFYYLRHLAPDAPEPLSEEERKKVKKNKYAERPQPRGNSL
jgi:radical SAM superfamily enzyme YgiQ (UPF0313 family)